MTDVRLPEVVLISHDPIVPFTEVPFAILPHVLVDAMISTFVIEQIGHDDLTDLVVDVFGNDGLPGLANQFPFVIPKELSRSRLAGRS